MKANELMLGDWVRIIDDDTAAFFDARVGTLTRVENIFVVPPGEEMAQPFSIDCVEPIPITQEILEKNFTRTEVRVLSGTKTHYIEGDDFYAVALNEYTDSIWEMEYTNCEAHFPLCRVLVAHVHEMQHALKMFGIDKEIVL